jgi:ubiquinone/menaquinone biosynthesis C-methylase UbiE
MAAVEAPDWDALAPYWHCFELGGLNQAILSTMLAAMSAPALYVGGGRGAYPARLQAHLSSGRLTIVDYSMNMARRARSAFGLPYVVADARSLPFAGSAFASALVATGVLEFLAPAGREGVLVELGRVSRPGAPILVAASAVPDSAPGDAPGATIHRQLARWFQEYHRLPLAERQPFRTYEAVAREMGDRAAAYHLLKASLPEYDRRLDLASFATTVAAAGLHLLATHYVAEQGVAVWRLERPAG